MTHPSTSAYGVATSARSCRCARIFVSGQCVYRLVWCVKQSSGNSHSVDNPEVEEDYVLRVDTSMDQPPFPLMLPHSPPEVIELDEDEPAPEPLKYSGRSIVIDDD